jgi:hypothetical protein
MQPAMAQSPVASDSIAEAIQIKVLDADTANAPTGSGSARGLTVQVADAAGMRVRDAAVIFRLPDTGSSARFADGTLAAVTYTDADGKAHVKDIRWGDTPSVMVRVTAVKGTAHAGLLFEHTSGPMTAPVSATAAQAVLPVQPPQPVVALTRVAQPQIIPGTVIPQRAMATRPPSPGNLPVVSVTNSGETEDDSPDTNVPARHSLGASNALEETPDVSISSSGAASSGHSKKKWIILLAIAAGAGSSLAFVHKGNSSSSSSSSGISIGSPTISVGHP